MKRLQTPGMVDGDDKNDMEDMEYMEHQGEDEDQVLKTMEKNPNKKAKEEKIKKMLIEAMATHEALTKNFFESNLKKKETQVHILCNLQFIYEMSNLGIHVFE
jgi:hypothetical protein